MDDRRRAQMQQATQRSRKRQKNESTTSRAQIDELRQRIAALRAQLALPVPPIVTETRELQRQQFVIEQRIAFLQTKMERHRVWVRELRKLLMTSPLLDLQPPDRTSDDVEAEDEESKEESSDSCTTGSEMEIDDDVVDAWRTQSLSTQFSMRMIEQLIQERSELGASNARRLLDEFAHASCPFEFAFASRGWTHAVNYRQQRVTFRSLRLLPQADLHAIADELWQSLRREEVLRTFVPVIFDCVQVYEVEELSLSRRMFQMATNGQPRAVDTVESMRPVGANAAELQISVESINDPCLKAFTAEQAISMAGATTGSGGNSATRFADTGNPQNSTHAVIRDLLVGMSCRQINEDVRIHIVGDVFHEGPSDDALSTTFLQHLVTFLPVFEDVHLAPRQNLAQLQAQTQS